MHICMNYIFMHKEIHACILCAASKLDSKQGPVSILAKIIHYSCVESEKF